MSSVSFRPSRLSGWRRHYDVRRPGVVDGENQGVDDSDGTGSGPAAARYRLRAGMVNAISAATTKQPIPPLTALMVGVVSEATVPDSTLPSGPPPVPMMYSTLDTRPRNSSGVTVCTIEPRYITVNVSAAPATASMARASGRRRVRPKQAIAAPQIMVPAVMPRPWRDTRAAGPDSTADSSPPTPGAALSSPRVCGEPPKCAAFRAGKSATGRPRSMASRSVRNAATSSGRCRMKRRPSAVDRRLDRKAVVAGGVAAAAGGVAAAAGGVAVGAEGRDSGAWGRMAGRRAVAYRDARKL